MRISAGTVAEGAAWVVFAAIFAVAVVMTDVLGFVGLFILGAIVWLACTRASQDEDPRVGRLPVGDRAEERPEQRAARHAAWIVQLDPIRFIGRCGMVLTTIGAAGFAWQYWVAAASNGH